MLTELTATKVAVNQGQAIMHMRQRQQSNHFDTVFLIDHLQTNDNKEPHRAGPPGVHGNEVPGGA